MRRSRLDGAGGLRRRPGFARAAARFFAELERVDGRTGRASPARCATGPATARGARYADEVAEVYRRYRDGLERRRAAWTTSCSRSGRSRRCVRRARACGRARRCSSTASTTSPRSSWPRSRRWRRTRGADVVVSLPFEPGREAFSATATVHATSSPSWRTEVAALEARLRPLRARLARGAARPGAGPVRGHGAAPAGRARPCGCTWPAASAPSWSCAAPRCCALLRGGTPPGEVAVVFRDPPATRRSWSRCSAPTGSRTRSTARCRWPTPASAAGCSHCCAARWPEGTRRRPARLPAHARVAASGRSWPTGWSSTCAAREADAAGARGRLGGPTGAGRSRSSTGWPRAGGGAELLDELEAVAWSGCSPGRTGARRTCSRAPSSTTPAPSAPPRRRIAELRAVAEADPELALDAQRVHDTLAAAAGAGGREPAARPGAGGLAAAGPRAPLRGRVRVRAPGARVPAPGGSGGVPRPTPTGARSRRASGMRLSLREDQLERERYLFYVCVSRAERLLVLSSRHCDEEGNPDPPSFFVDDARAVFADLEDHERTTLAGRCDLDASTDAPTDAEWERAVAHARARAGARRGRPARGAAPRWQSCADREVVSAGALERFAGCPVKWLVEDVLRPDKLEPDPEPMVRGSYAHKRARADVPASCASGPARARHAGQPGRGRADPARGARRAARRVPPLAQPDARARGGAAARVRPPALPAPRGRPRRAVRARAPGAAVRVRGLRAPRRRAGGRHPGAGHDRPRGHLERARARARLQERQGGQLQGSDWESERRLQAALYMLVVERALGAAGRGRRVRAARRHQPNAPRAPGGRAGRRAGRRLRGQRLQARGPSSTSTPSGRGVRWPRWPAGCAPAELASCPDTCAYRGGCSYPSICRAEG